MSVSILSCDVKACKPTTKTLIESFVNLVDGTDHPRSGAPIGVIVTLLWTLVTIALSVGILASVDSSVSVV